MFDIMNLTDVDERLYLFELIANIDHHYRLRRKDNTPSGGPEESEESTDSDETDET